jgi:hypothetical protein
LGANLLFYSAGASATETADTDTLGRSSSVENLDQRINGRIVLGIQVEVGVRKRRKELIKTTNRMVTTDSGLGYFRPRQLADLSLAIGHPVEGVIVKCHSHAVSGDVDVRLQMRVPQTHGVFERARRVLRMNARAATVSER